MYNLGTVFVIGRTLAFHPCSLSSTPGVSMWTNYGRLFRQGIFLECANRDRTFPPEMEYTDSTPIQAVCNVWDIMLVEHVYKHKQILWKAKKKTFLICVLVGQALSGFITIVDLDLMTLDSTIWRHGVSKNIWFML